MRLINCLILAVVCSGFCFLSYGQVSIPNIDFESGTYANWSFYTGTCCTGGIITATTHTPALPTQHSLTSGAGTDYYGGFPVVSPYGGGHSLKLGNNLSGRGAEKCRYYLHVPMGMSYYSLIYHYAVVLEYPHHTPYQQPRMYVSASDSATGALLACDTFTYVSDGTTPGFILSPRLGPSGDTVYYKPWTCGHLRFEGLGGHTVTIEFATGDCDLGGHFGYGYVDMSSGLFADSYITCDSGTTLLSGPHGFAAYTWYDSATFTVIGTGQYVTIPAPGVPTSYAVIVTPYPGYGCVDTLYTRLTPPGMYSGTPPIGYIYGIRGAACTDPDTLVASGYAYICGLTYQWQSSPDNIAWSVVPGATSRAVSYYHSHTGIYYRCAVSCSASGMTSYSASAFIRGTSGPGLYTVINPPDTICNGASFYVSTCGHSPSYHVVTWYGDGTNNNILLTASPVCHALINHNYAFPGTYSIRQVLYDGATAVDSTIFSYEYLYCSTLPVKLFFDFNSDCIFGTGETRVQFPVKTEIDSNGIPIDTVTSLGGFYYLTTGSPGTIYASKVLPASDLTVTCPSGGVFHDTIVPMVNMYPERYFGLACSTPGIKDLSLYISGRCGRHEYQGNILVQNTGCTIVPPVVKLAISPKFHSIHSIPAPSGVVGNEVTWTLAPMTTSGHSVTSISYILDRPGPNLPLRDTIHSHYSVGPMTGDVDTLNNMAIKIDTVVGSFDPNYIEVAPQGYISSGTKLQYVIHFENTGNDTAFNIHVMDTLSDYLDAKSFEMVAASAEMNLAVFNIDGRNIAKFDFPHINLLDSSHHGECEGMFVYTIKTKSGLPDGTIIPNRAGIYFDDNDVVMTNTVNNIIGIPVIDTSTSVSNIDRRNAIDIFPNPATNELTIRLNGAAYTSLVITNHVGQVLVQQPVNGTAAKVNTATLPAGMYFITLKGSDGMLVRKFVKM